MPNIITHKIFAEETEKQLNQAVIQQMIKENKRLFVIGSNGPDPFFFYEAKFWNLFPESEPSDIGNIFHCEKVNAFFEAAIQEIKEEKDRDKKNRMSVYLFGHLCHWAIDMNAHPYVYHRTGDCVGMSLNYHHRFESVLDEVMLRTMRGKSIKELYVPDICTYNKDMLEAISAIYVPVVQRVLERKIDKKDVQKSLDGWKFAQKCLRDPYHIKLNLWGIQEKIIREKWKMSGNIVPCKNENDFDVLNLKHNVWYHPCDEKIQSTISFLEIFVMAKKDAVNAILQAYRCIYEDENTAYLCDILKNRAYDTAMPEVKPMNCFNICFEEK